MTPQKQRLLFLSHRLPYPLHNGQSVRTHNLLRVLADAFEITALCFDPDDSTRPDMSRADRCAGLPALAKLSVFRLPADLSRWRRVSDHLKSVLARRPFTYFMYRSAEFERELFAELAGKRFDTVYFESFDLCGIVPMVDHRRRVLTHHNVESLLLRRRAAAERNAGRAAYIALQAHLHEAEEARLLPEVQMNIAVSEEDASTLRRLGPGADVCCVPNGVDVRLYTPRPVTQSLVQRAAFLGGLGWFPNGNALEWYVAQIHPLILRALPSFEAVWIGSAPDALRTQYESVQGLRLVGYVPDPRDDLKRSGCFIAPLRVGGGTRLKILEAWALGLPVVSTSVGAEGLAYEDDSHILIRDDPSAFAEAVVRVLRDAELARRLGENGRRLAEEQYSWEVVGKRLVDLLRA